MTVEHVNIPPHPLPPSPPLLRVENLSLRHLSRAGPTTILSDVSFALGRGEILGIIGESGAGKSTVGNAILGLLAPEFQQTSGTISFDGKAFNAMTAGEREALRGKRISAIFQDHTASLDPLMSVGAQVQETCLAVDPSLSRRAARARAIDLLARVGIPEPERRYGNYPHQFSGGQRQRIVIAIALAGSPDIIIADEPTSALDATVQKQVLQLLRTLVDETGVSVILVTHDMGVISEITDRVLVMKKGQVVEADATVIILDQPRHDYTKKLLAAVPRLRIPAQVATAEDKVADRNGPDGSGAPDDAGVPLLVAEGISKEFSPQGFQWGLGLGLGRKRPSFGLSDVGIRLPRGTITGIVGESGSGKTTFGRILAGLDSAHHGRIVIGEQSYEAASSGRRSGLLGRVQMIFQDPSVSLNPRMTIGETLEESIRFGAEAGSRDKPIAETAAMMMDRLGLARSLSSRHPHQLSGGQKQRVCIARALLAKPQIIVADEPTSALDVSVQAEIVTLLKETIAGEDMTMVFISHDLAIVQTMCSAVYIFKNGRVEDFGSSDFIFSHSDNAYTRSLIAARPERFTC
ncbi:peptide ABC transporter ATP-binding protein (plasmid) [Ensifer adhaerens]|uniref:ABC transporter ATP-binding protein n=1 Tax=Ensifer adhaerens TaxID=106592 RepID=A0ABY8HS21_ENSAD|nr:MULTISPECIES: ABC transporter ATP-binding protein [Ensifer]ANK77630.1 peptide ABC transporter ATP-binding protein [Ensifer adhaerens]KDP74050.1 peptide ABC transporter ATP-binding protein [Ensifer adhaerens]WFP94909.1 ABC transporter ATP-binding protein [Ensifer adhaerens]SFH37182.1 peptide/nickel transport system ATP-binding protein [Ensifer sp. OV372]